MKTKTFAALLAVGIPAVLAVVIGVALAAYPGSIGQMGTDNWVQTSPLAVNVTSGSLTVVTVNGGTAATATVGISGGTLDKLTAGTVTVSSGTVSLVGSTVAVTSGTLTQLTGGTLGQLTSGTVAISGGTVTIVSPIPGYAIKGSGAFVLAGTNTVAFYVSSGTTTATSTACNSVTLSLAGTGMVTSGGTSGMGFATSSTSAWSSPLTLSATNLNTLAVTGTGQVGFLYSQ